jgi:hypothetical protein
LGNDAAVDRATTRSEVMGRIEHGVSAGYSDFFIEERMLKSYCSNMSFGYANFKRYLEAQFTVSYIAKKDMMSKTSAPPMRVTAMKISRAVTEVDETLIHQVSLAKD